MGSAARIDVLGVGFDDITIGQAVECACDSMRGEGKAYFVTPNPEIVWVCRRNDNLRNVIDGAKLVLADGIGIILGARILGTPLQGGRIPGINFAAALFMEMAETGGSVFLLGSIPGVAVEAGKKLTEEYPGLVVTGTADGYFNDDAPVIEKINSASPDLLLVCLGAPKQEFWMAENAGKLDVPLSVGLGGALDIFAGKTKRAPALFQKLGLEWLYRLIREPRRLKRMTKLPLFLFTVIAARFGGKRQVER